MKKTFSELMESWLLSGKRVTVWLKADGHLGWEVSLPNSPFPKNVITGKEKKKGANEVSIDW